MKTRISFFILLFSFFIFHFSEAQIIHVPADQPTIQAGIDAATAGDTVLVANGTYLENISFMGKAILVASQFIVDGDTNHINNTIIDGHQHGPVVSFVSGEDTTSVLSGFTITAGSGMYDPGLHAQFGGGIAYDGSGCKIIHNKIVNNHVVSTSNLAGCGGMGNLLSSGDVWVIVENNIISNNSVSAGGLYAFAGGLCIASNGIIKGNTIENNSCVNTGNLFNSESTGGGVEIDGSYDSIEVRFIDNVVRNNIAEGRIVYGAGIAIIKTNPLVTGNLISFNSGSATVTNYGGGICIWNPLGDMQITGNEISNNIASGNEADGAGVFMHLMHKTEFVNNTTSYNRIMANNKWYGAGVICNDPIRTTTFRNNTFSGNSGTIFSSYPILIDEGNGGGLVITDAYSNQVLLDGNFFLNDTAKLGGGLYIRDCYSLAATNNIFHENHSFQGGGIFFLDTGRKYDCGNESARDNMRPAIVNNNFLVNSAIESGGAVFCGPYEPGGPVFINDIFRENWAGNESGNDIYLEDESDTILVAYSIITPENIAGNWTGAGNKDEEPGFADSSFHIDPASPCYDAGIDSIQYQGIWYYSPDHDFEGSPRPFGDGIDIGADEWDNTGITQFKIQNSKFKIYCYPNPTVGIVDCRWSMDDGRCVTMKIYDLHGREVINVLDKKMTAGEHTVWFDLSGFPDGIYFIRVQAGEEAVTGKMVKM